MICLGYEHMTTVQNLRQRFAVLLLTALVLVGLPTTSAQAVTQLEAVAEQVFHQRHIETRTNPGGNGVNDHPAAAEIPGYTDLLDIARRWSAQMASDDDLYHNPNLGNEACCWRRIGENVAVYKGPLDTESQVRAAVERLMNAWRGSSGHRRNIMDGSWDGFAVGVVIRDNGLWATGVFRTLDGSTPPGTTYGNNGPGDRQDASANTPPKDKPVARNVNATCDEVDHPGYADSNGKAHDTSIQCASGHGLANGKSSSSYDPAGAVTRGQVMAFLRRAVERSGYALDENAPDYFSDDNGTAHELSANMLAHAGFVPVGNGKLKPGAPATRAFIAGVAGRALEQLKGVSTERDFFADDDGHADEKWINVLAEAGVVTGASNGTFGPDLGLTRAQIATVLVRAFDALRA